MGKPIALFCLPGRMPGLSHMGKANKQNPGFPIWERPTSKTQAFPYGKTHCSLKIRIQVAKESFANENP